MIGRYIGYVSAQHFNSSLLVNRKRRTLLLLMCKSLQEKMEKLGFTVLIKDLLGTDPYKGIQYGDRLHFADAQAGTHATELLSYRLQGMEETLAEREPSLFHLSWV